MGARWSRANVLQDFEGRLHRMPIVVRKSIDSDLEFLTRQSAQEMQELIDQRRNRRSGNMYNDVGYRKNPHQANDVFSWEFGWINGWQPYYGYQEKGFHHYPDYGWIEGAFMLRDAATAARDRLTMLGPALLAKAVAALKGSR